MKKFVMAAVAACGLAMGITVSAEEEPADENDIGTVTCRDILMASGEDRDGAILVLHGYVLGEKKQLKYDTEVLSVATDAFLNDCIDNPDKQALQALRDQLK